MKMLFIIGCGDLGARVANLASQANIAVTALVRSEARAVRLREQGITTIQGDLDDPVTLPELPTKGATVLYLVPPPGGGLTDPRARSFCRAIAAGNEPDRFVYLSTTAVYGDQGGETVTEESATAPGSSRGKRRLDAETAIKTWCVDHAVPVIFLRVAAIYGPGRIPLHHLKNGHPLLNEDEAPLSNRIHVDDLAQVCLAALHKGDSGDIFNVSDGQPTTLTAYFNLLSDQLGLPRLPQVSLAEARAVMAPLMYSYFTESKLVDNRKMLTRLGIALRYPSIAEGVATIVDGMEAGLAE
ncbi:MAG TPA: SDR family oxidoreductase [Geobacteraceae bacterium]